AFATPVAVDSDPRPTETRVAVGPGGSALVAFTRADGCGESSCTGPPTVAALSAGGVPGTAFGPTLVTPRRALAPSAALTSAGGGLLVFEVKTKRSPFSTLWPVHAVRFRANGTVGKVRRLTSERAGEPVVLPLSRGRALALWVSSKRIGTALARRGGALRRTPAPAGPPPDVFHTNSTNRDLRTGGRYAIFAWSRRDGVVRVSVRRF
ncbi:MAG: hypothetical protein M3401_07155, partial [Actinomycetota bacterium]|nr:hypothetical protein [Actinomycetota bacterium]